MFVLVSFYLGASQDSADVGTTGDAAPDAPQLHFAISRRGPDKRWWKGEPIDPYPILLRVVSADESGAGVVLQERGRP